eukprot:TRINITY_DN14205_c0_g1_i2.p1 TRINITY_DN14205_c0_g1~~TRINITY_DN14205_c0_g1_i2.p1  ORF type:complete len:219 (+),score=30.66 TRINITY_DN14205_c0_g1_i2:1-657(+)
MCTVLLVDKNLFIDQLVYFLFCQSSSDHRDLHYPLRRQRQMCIRDSSPYQKQCLGQKLSLNTLLKGKFISEQNKFSVKVLNPSKQAVFEKSKEESIQFSFAAENYGNYEICVENTEAMQLTVDVVIQYGAAAKDYSQVAEKQDVSKLDLTIKKMEDLIKNVKTDLNYIVVQEEKRIFKVDDVSFKIICFSVVTIILLVILAAIQTSYLKNFFRQKKLI